MSNQDKIARNTTYLTIASMLQKAIALVYFAIIGKELGPALAGKYGVALSFTSIFIIFMDFGIGQVLTREGAKHEDAIQHIIARLFRVKMVLIIASFIACIVTIFAAHAFLDAVDTVDLQLVLIGSIVIVLDTMTFTLFSIFRALRALQWEAMSLLIYQFAIFAVGMIGVRYEAPVHFYIFALLAGSTLQLGFLYVVFRLRTPYRLFSADADSFNMPSSATRDDSIALIDTTKQLLYAAAPFAVAGIIFRLTGSIDGLMLKVWEGDAAAGWYSLAFKLIIALTVIPGAFAAAYYPMMSAAIQKKSPQIQDHFMESLIYMLVVSVPITFAIFVVGGDIIVSVWRELYRASLLPLKILAIGLPFIFMNYPIGYLLNASGKQHINTMNMGISLVINIIANLIFIPTFSYAGAALAATISSVFVVFLGIPWTTSIAPIRWGELSLHIFKIVSVSAIMMFVLFWTQHTYPLLIVILIGIVVYSLGIVFSGVVTIPQIRGIIQKVLKRAA